MLVDRAWMIVEANRPAIDVFGERLVGSPLVRAFRHPDAMRAISAVQEGAPRAQAEFTILVEQPVLYRMSATSLSGSDLGEPALAVTLKDISPLRAAQQMRSDFVANVSHELRSPLTTLTGLIETLSGPARDDPDARARFLGIMTREAARMDRLIGDLLSLSRVEADERVRPTERLDLVELIRRVLAIIRERPEAEGRSITFDPAEPVCMTAGDPDQLTQVFQNLLENAVKYSRAGGPVSLTIEGRGSAPRFASSVWAISVRDEGEGIDPEHIPRLTERFYRVDSGRSRQMGGTGLGLAIVKHIVSRHRGRLMIQSAPGEGTTVTVLLQATERPPDGDT